MSGDLPHSISNAYEKTDKACFKFCACGHEATLNNGQKGKSKRNRKPTKMTIIMNHNRSPAFEQSVIITEEELELKLVLHARDPCVALRMYSSSSV